MLRKLLCSRSVCTAIVLLVLTAALVRYKLAQPDPVSSSNFRGISIGMTRAELEKLFGNPESETLEIGIVNDSASYSTNRSHPAETLRNMGYNDYKRLQWASPEITIVVILDKQDLTVCRYRAEGQRSSRRFRLPFGWHIPFLGL